jgi:hypothetical protein
MRRVMRVEKAKRGLGSSRCHFRQYAFWLRDSPSPLYRFVPVVRVLPSFLISSVDYREEAEGAALGKSRSHH